MQDTSREFKIPFYQSMSSCLAVLIFILFEYDESLMQGTKMSKSVLVMFIT